MDEEKVKIRELSTLDPTKIYILQYSSGLSLEEIRALTEQVDQVSTKWGLQILMLSSDMQFVQLPPSPPPLPKDKNGKEMELKDFTAAKGVRIQIGEKRAANHSVLVEIDGKCVLKIETPIVQLWDDR